ncbi:hypothetical protein C2E23DRAFT_927322 [Lenzites betulinus]|nr:hypothetical protein C2E23DRAFT_927322 [Lenzites betulinus]
MSNFTLDDTDPSLSYSSNGWAVQSPTDPDLTEFFDETYHAAQADGATMSFTFQGTAFALYGSKGPGHGKFQVQFDSTVVNLDASASQTAFRQQLFAHTFSPPASTHLVKVTAVLSGDGLQGRWMDVDYITFSSAPSNATSTDIGTITSSPPWLTVQPPTTSPSNVPKILAIVFGALIGVALIALAVYFVLRRGYDLRRARERAFRYGQSSAHPSVSLAGTTYAHSAAGSGKSTGSPPIALTPLMSPGMQMSALNGSGAMIDLVPVRRESPSVARDGSVGGLTMSTGVDANGRPSRDGAGTPMSGRLMNASPIAWTRQKQKHKGDADSLATDFLQV